MANDLARHITPGPGHDSLAFHFGCARCREERSLGQPGSRSGARRLGLGLAAVALMAAPLPSAFAGPPPPVVAPDQESEGVSDADDQTAQEPDGAALDPEGDDTRDAETGDPAVDGDGDDDAAGPLETPAAPDVVDPAEVQADAPAAQPPSPRAPAPPTQAPDSPAPLPHRAESPPSAPASPAPRSTAAPEDVRRNRAGEGRDHPSTARPQHKLGAVLERRGHPSLPAYATSIERQPSASAPKPLVAPSALSSARPPGRDGPTSPTAEATPHSASTRVIARGDTLWSIARERLGGRPTTAAIAREVQRLWDLNADRIGTGSPDLIITGQVLRLR